MEEDDFIVFQSFIGSILAKPKLSFSSFPLKLLGSYRKHHAAERWDLVFGSNTTDKFENALEPPQRDVCHSLPQVSNCLVLNLLGRAAYMETFQSQMLICFQLYFYVYVSI